VYRLLLMRHAKSSWSDESLDDHDRPLDERGERAAALMGTFLAQSGVEIDQVLCSTALRARQTAERLAPLVALPEPTLEQGLYLASGRTLLDRLRRLSEAVRCVLLIGHNPGLADLAESIAGRGPSDELDAMLRKFPTAALASFDVGPSGWSGLRTGSATLERFVTPKRLV
jgi:phosphohistidine phosphatase